MWNSARALHQLARRPEIQQAAAHMGLAHYPLSIFAIIFINTSNTNLMNITTTILYVELESDA